MPKKLRLSRIPNEAYPLIVCAGWEHIDKTHQKFTCCWVYSLFHEKVMVSHVLDQYNPVLDVSLEEDLTRSLHDNEVPISKEKFESNPLFNESCFFVE